jgi:hypothetical protein
VDHQVQNLAGLRLERMGLYSGCFAHLNSCWVICLHR